MKKNIRIEISRYPLEKNKGWTPTLLTMLGLTGLVAGCGNTNIAGNTANAQSLPSPTPSATPWSTATPTTLPPAATPTMLPTPTHTPWPTSTPWPSPTPWSAPQAWNPVPIPLPSLDPVPLESSISVPVTGNIPVSYSPPDGVDIFGSTLLRWVYPGVLAENEWFDIKIKPVGSENSVFVDWSKVPEYRLNSWSGWSPGLYTWQIGIVQGTKEGDTKHFIADTGRDSAKFVIKWQVAGHHGSGDGGSSSVGGGGGNSGGGGSSGGS